MENVSNLKEKLATLIGDFFVENKVPADDAHYLLTAMVSALFKDSVRAIYMREQIDLANKRKAEMEKAELAPTIKIQEH